MPHNEHNARAPTVCKELWFHDGNIIIQAGNLVFKVFRSILSRESTVFNEMIFALPPPASPSQGNAMASFDGLPLVCLTDTEDEIRLFLSVIYDANYLDERASSRDHVILLGIAAKYQATRVLRRVMVFLGHAFPDTAQAYDHQMKEREAYGCSAVPRTCAPHLVLNDMFLMLKVAPESGMRVLYPAALIMLATTAPDEVISDHIHHGIPSADAFSVGAAKVMLEQLARSLILPTLLSGQRDISKSCDARPSCRRVQQEIENLVSENNRWIDLPFHLLHSYGATHYALLCLSCQRALEETYASLRDNAWETLPSVLGLGSWQDLRAARAKLLDATVST